MDTKPLERFATTSRRELINAVDAQATAVLAAGSVARSERADVVKRLEAEIGRHGRQHVVDKVAYTWFNRIIALRFMDARGYTDSGVVSPAQGQAHGQPEILADAKRGNLDTAVVMNNRTANAIIGLLDGTRRSTDAEGEAYALLLTEYCRYWHKSMPFIFEREGDYTELLVPANLLADDSILARARSVLSVDVCKDVEVIGWLYQFYISERKQEVFDGFSAKGAARKLAGPDEIPAATQLFTPHWIVRYLVENSVGRLWLLNRPSSTLADLMHYYTAPVSEETDFRRISSPEDLKILDPACGSGHMLTYAFDLLYAIYEEEGYAPSEIPELILTHNLYGTEIDPRAGSLAAFALAMKAREKQRTFLSKQVEPNVCVLEPVSFSTQEMDLLVTASGERHDEQSFWNQFEYADIFGSLIRPDRKLTPVLRNHLANLDSGSDLFSTNVLARAERIVKQAEYLGREYSVVVTNPPYMGSGNMASILSSFAKREYRESKSDLFAMFMQRSFEMLDDKGYSAMVTMESWMFLRGYQALRERIVTEKSIMTMVHMPYLGKGGTPMGINFGTAATVVRDSQSGASSAMFQCVRYFETDSSGVPLTFPVQNERTAEVTPRKFLEIPGMPIAYWASDALLGTFKSGRRIEDVAPVRQGFQTGDNDRFMRLWFEVSRRRVCFDANSTEEFHASGAKFAPYLKGGNVRKWFGNDEYVVAFDRASYAALAELGNKLPSRSLYFAESITWSALSSGDFGARYAGVGSTFSAKGACAFPATGYARDLVLAILNSSVTGELLEFMGATLDFNVGSLREIPLPAEVSIDEQTLLREFVNELIDLHREDWNADELAPGFERNPLVSAYAGMSLRFHTADLLQQTIARTKRVVEVQTALDGLVSSLYGLPQTSEVSLTLRLPMRQGDDQSDYFNRLLMRGLVSYAVGCMFGRYGVDVPGLIVADQGAAISDYLAKIPAPSFPPDVDNVIPFVDDGWFEDDIVERFRQFLRAAFGVDHFEDNLRYVEESLGVKTLRDYFITKAGKSRFYDDHLARYKKRPIYWMFSSSKGSFNALIYMHRYSPSTVSTVLNEYLREYRAKLEVAFTNAEQAGAGGASVKDQIEADRLRKVLVELAEYEHDTLYPLATQQVAIDLDDGVKINYPKFYPALKKIIGLEAAE